MLKEPIPNPDTVLQKIGGRIEAYRNLLYDAHLSSCIQSRKSGTLKLKWDIKKNDSSDIEIEFIKKNLGRLNLKKIISEMLEAPLFGYKIMEIIYRYDKGKIIPADIKGRPQEWFVFDANNLPYFINSTGNKEALLPKKFFVIQHNSNYNNPYGSALLSNCYWYVIYKKDIIGFWATFTEKYGMPFLKGTVAVGSTESKVNEMIEKLDDLRQDGVIVYEDDAMTNVDIIRETSSASVEIYKSLIEFFNSEISKAILSSTLTSEVTDKGTYAASKTHQEVRQDIIDADKELIEIWFNKLIQWLIEKNFGLKEVYPEFILYEEQDVDAGLADVVAKLSPNIQFTKQFYKNNFYWTDEDFDIKAIQEPLFANSPQNNISGMEKFNEVTRNVIENIVKMIMSKNSFEEIEEYLVSSLPDIDTKEIEDILSKSIKIAETGGMLNWK
jgi:phage gp29-like protein